MRRALLISVFLALTACGIDGPPSKPSGGITVGGDARIGAVGSL